MKIFLIIVVILFLVWIVYEYFSSRVKEPKFVV